jgi:hypothetical protein
MKACLTEGRSFITVRVAKVQSLVFECPSAFGFRFADSKWNKVFGSLQRTKKNHPFGWLFL